MGGKFADVGKGEVALAAQNHRAQVAAPAQDAGEVHPAQPVLGEQVLEDVWPRGLGPLHMVGVVGFQERAEEVELVALVGREIVHPQRHRVSCYGPQCRRRKCRFSAELSS